MTPPGPGRADRSTILRALRVSLHVLFAALLGIGALLALLPAPRGVETGAERVGVVLLTFLLAAAYLAGTVWENRTARAADSTPPSRGPAAAWLMGVILLWILLLALSVSFTWLAFPLMFLALHVLRPLPGLVTVLLLWTVSWALPLWDVVDGRPGAEFSAGAVLGPFIGTVLAIIISWAYRGLHAEALRHHRTAESLRLAQDELARKEKQAGRFEERERISREIHDTLAQGLSSILLISRATQATPAAQADSALAEQLDTIESVASENLAEARRFVRELAAPAPSIDLPEQLRALGARVEAEAHAAGSPLRCVVRIEGADPLASASELPEPIARTLLRASQASLANVTAHAQARTAVLTLALWEAEVTLDVYDDGRGFHPTAPSMPRHEADSGYGLPGLARRVEEAGGSLSVESAPGEGTVVGIRIPLTSARALAESDHHTGPADHALPTDHQEQP